MGLKFNQAALEQFRDLFLAAQSSTVLHLFSNNVTPDETFSAGSMTECTFTGYSSAAMTPGVASFASGEASNPFDDVIFTCTGGTDNVYGYYVTNAAGAYLWGERDPAGPFAISTGQTYTVSPRYGVKNQ